MQKTASMALAMGCLSLLTGCVSFHPGVLMGVVRTPARTLTATVSGNRIAVIPPQGAIWTNVRAPATAGVTGKPQGSRTGEATVSGIALPPLPIRGMSGGTPLFSWGDASEEAAMADGGITDVTGIDYEGRVILMIYRSLTLRVHGN